MREVNLMTGDFQLNEGEDVGSPSINPELVVPAGSDRNAFAVEGDRSAETVARLQADGDIDVSEIPEAELDVASVLKEYVRVDRELTERAKDILEIRGLDHGHFGRTKRSLAEEKDFGLGDDAVQFTYVSPLFADFWGIDVEEIYADDATLRRKIRQILQKHMSVDEELDREVRQRIKNLEEGTQTWDIEYGKVMDQMKQKFGVKE